MSFLNLRSTNRFTINQIKKNLKIKLKKKMTKRFFSNAIKILNDTAPIHKKINGSKTWF